MDIESQGALLATVDRAETALQAVVDSFVTKLEVALRDILADAVAAADGWELSITPFKIKLQRSIKQ